MEYREHNLRPDWQYEWWTAANGQIFDNCRGSGWGYCDAVDPYSGLSPDERREIFEKKGEFSKQFNDKDLQKMLKTKHKVVDFSFDDDDAEYAPYSPDVVSMLRDSPQSAYSNFARFKRNLRAHKNGEIIEDDMPHGLVGTHGTGLPVNELGDVSFADDETTAVYNLHDISSPINIDNKTGLECVDIDYIDGVQCDIKTQIENEKNGMNNGTKREKNGTKREMNNGTKREGFTVGVPSYVFLIVLIFIVVIAVIIINITQTVQHFKRTEDVLTKASNAMLNVG